MEQKRLTFFSAQENRAWQDVRGWLLPAAAEELYRCASMANPNGYVVEIGSYSGKSTLCIARALEDNIKRGNTQQMVAVDVKFQHDFADNLTQFGLYSCVNIMENTSLEVAENWGKPVSFLYIDGHHGKAHAYADFMVWDTLIMLDGIVALDDTAGFMLGPNLQMQAAIRTGAYQLLSEVGGVSFLKKTNNLLPFISDFPLAEGSLIAYTDYVSSWLGAMDPAFRLPQKPYMAQNNNHDKSLRRRAVNKLLDISPRQVLHFISKKLTSRKQEVQAHVNIDNSGVKAPGLLKKPGNILNWLEMKHYPDEAVEHTLSYLSACLNIRLNHIDKAVKKLERLSGLDNAINFIHYNISIREMSTLRLAQSYDIKGDRGAANKKYQDLMKECTIPEIRHYAELGLSKPFQMPNVDNKLLLREYNLPMNKYRATHYNVHH